MLSVLDKHFLQEVQKDINIPFVFDDYKGSTIPIWLNESNLYNSVAELLSYPVTPFPANLSEHDILNYVLSSDRNLAFVNIDSKNKIPNAPEADLVTINLPNDRETYFAGLSKQSRKELKKLLSINSDVVVKRASLSDLLTSLDWFHSKWKSAEVQQNFQSVLYDKWYEYLIVYVKHFFYHKNCVALSFYSEDRLLGVNVSEVFEDTCYDIYFGYDSTQVATRSIGKYMTTVNILNLLGRVNQYKLGSYFDYKSIWLQKTDPEAIGYCLLNHNTQIGILPEPPYYKNKKLVLNYEA
jgi:hypothetical protein